MAEAWAFLEEEDEDAATEVKMWENQSEEERAAVIAWARSVLPSLPSIKLTNSKQMKNDASKGPQRLMVEGNGKYSDDALKAFCLGLKTRVPNAIFQGLDFSIGRGEKAPDLALKTLSTLADTTLHAEIAGQVVMIDFWATWCGPCQKPMEHNQEMMHKNKDAWQGKAKIIGVGMDETSAALTTRVTSKGWGDVHHLWAPEGFAGVQAYGVNGIPTCLIIDKTGTIAWRGHPASLDIEAAINKLLSTDGICTAPILDRDEEEEANSAAVVCTDEMCSLTGGAHGGAGGAGMPFVSYECSEFAGLTRAAEEKIAAGKLNLTLVGMWQTTYQKAEEKTTGKLLLVGEIPAGPAGDAQLEEVKATLTSKINDLDTQRVRRITYCPAPTRLPNCSNCSNPIAASSPCYVCIHCEEPGATHTTFCDACEALHVARPPTPLHNVDHFFFRLFPESVLTSLRFGTGKFPVGLNYVSGADESHGGVRCDGCGGRVKFARWKCCQCPDFDYCPACYALFEKGEERPNEKSHPDKTHVFAKMCRYSAPTRSED